MRCHRPCDTCENADEPTHPLAFCVAEEGHAGPHVCGNNPPHTWVDAVLLDD